MESPLSESSVSLKLSLIRKRCEELLAQEDNELRLEDFEAEASGVDGAYNPYNRI